MIEIHTIPVPEGWSAEQAWEAISRGEKTPAPQTWANVEVDAGKLTHWMPVEVRAGMRHHD